MDATYYNEIVRLLPTPVLILRPENSDFIIVSVNDAYLNIGNFVREEIIGKRFFDAFPGDPYIKIPDWLESFQRVMRDKSPDKVPTKQYIDFLNGVLKVRFFDVENVPVLNELNEVEYIIRTVNDITAIVEAQERSQRALDKLVSKEKFLCETQRVGLSGSWEVDLIFNKVTWSDVQRDIHEVGREYEPKMINLIDFYKDEADRLLMAGLVNDAINYGKIFDVEVEIMTAKGKTRLVRVTGKSEIRDGKSIRLYGVTQDITERKLTELELQDSKNRFQTLLTSVDGIVWEARMSDFALTYISEQTLRILGYSQEQVLTVPNFFYDHLHPDDKEEKLNYFIEQSKKSSAYNLEFRLQRADGHYIWIKSHVSVVSEKGKPDLLRGLMIDITANKRMGEIDYLERKIFELYAKNKIPLKEVLAEYVRGIESLFTQMHCSILQVEHNRLYTWAAPSLPLSYINAIEGLDIGKSIGSCGAAAFLKQPVIVTDICNDFRWATHRGAALKANLKACWSYPILDSQGEVMATFGIYYDQVKSPDEEELTFIARATSLLSILLENKKISTSLKDTTDLMNRSQALAQFGIWAWDVKHDEVTWSDSLYHIYGIEKEGFKPSFESYLKILHKEDQERVSAGIGKVLSTKEVHQFEERIIRPDGEVRWLKSWSRPKLDEKGRVIELIGASIDFTERRKIEEELLASESRLRSLVETQTSYVVRVDFLGNYTYCNHKYQEDFGWIYEGKDMIGQPAVKAVLKHHYQRLFDVGEKCAEHPNVVFKEEVDKPGKGGIKHTLWHFVCLTDSRGLPAEIQCTGIDVTEWKVADNELRSSNERYQFVNRANNDAIYDWDIEKDQIEWGDGYQRLFGYEVNNVFSLQEWSERIHKDDTSFVEKDLESILADPEGLHWSVEYRYRKADKSYAYIEEVGYIIRNQEKKAVRMIGALRDVTERKIAESEHQALSFQLQENLVEMAMSNAELAESRQRYKDLFHLSPQPMYVYETESLMFVDVNRAAIEFYGYSREEFLSMDITKIRPAEDIENLLRVVEKGPDRKLISHGIFRHLKKNGELVYVDIQSNAIQFNTAETNLVLARDISDRLKYLNAIENQNAIFKEISWMQSHVVRAPLSRLMSLIDLIRRDHHFNEDEKKLLEHMLSSANELDDIIRDISKKTEGAALNSSPKNNQ